MSQTNFKWPTERISLGCSYRVRNGTGKKHLNLGTFASDIFQREEKLNPKRKRNIKQVYTYYYW